MRIAIDKARDILSNGDFPVAAVLTIDGVFIDCVGNSIQSGGTWASHAERMLLVKHSNQIREAVTNRNSDVVIYSTLEPCLMCLGTSVLHRVKRIVYACKDPHGGSTKIDPNSIGDWYVKRWPQIDYGLFQKESYELLTTFMKRKNTPTWNRILKLYENLSLD